MNHNKEATSLTFWRVQKSAKYRSLNNWLCCSSCMASVTPILIGVGGVGSSAALLRDLGFVAVLGFSGGIDCAFWV